MWWLAFGLGLGLAPPERPPVQRPGDAVVWALTWEAPDECPSREDVIARVQGFLPELEPPPLDPSRADLRVSVRVTAEPEEFHALVDMSGRDGATVRRFSAPACAELAEAVALISAVALDPVLVAREVAGRSEADPDLEPEPEPPPPEPSGASMPEPELDFDLVVAELEAEPSRTRDVILGVGVLGTGGWGPATAGFGGVAGSFAVFARRWRWQLEGGYAFPRTLSLADGRRGRIQAWWLGTRGCVVPSLGAVELPLCPGVEAGQVLARGRPPTTNIASASQPWAAIVVGQGLRWPLLERLALTVEAAVLVAVVRGQFLIGDQTFASLTAVGFRGGLGLELRF